MANKNSGVVDTLVLPKLIRKLLIVELALAGTSQSSIRAIAGGDINEINAIVKLLPKRTS